MKQIIIFFQILPILILFMFTHPVFSQGRMEQSLNGIWQFEQTGMAFPPDSFSMMCPVPGLIHMAVPKFGEYEKFFRKPEAVETAESHNLLQLDYQPKYSWYRRTVFVDGSLEGNEVTLTLLKSQFVTQVYINGMDMGSSQSCYTPIVLPVTSAIRFGRENEILVRVGDRVWLPGQAAGSTDKEKAHYLPGIWDNVFLSFTGKLFIQDMLAIPSVKEKMVTVKLRIRSYYPAQILYGDPMYDTCLVNVNIIEKSSGKRIAHCSFSSVVKRDNITVIKYDIPVEEFTRWSPEDPFLYRLEAGISVKNTVSDESSRNFGMRDFSIQDRFFNLNGEKYMLRGTNITLHRFFEDPDCGNLPWDTAWVKKMLIDIPKSLNWNAMRICVGIVPDFWYDIADEYGMMFQNEWMYWQNHGWDDQVRSEYTDWVWSDGNHPSIVIWDAINENWDSYIGNRLIPELKNLDPSRVWDAGYMTGEDMILDEMDEPHPYRAGWDLMISGDGDAYFKQNPYRLGKLDEWPAGLKQNMLESPAAQLVNEYGWIWLWRDGRPAKLTKVAYDYFLGENATAGQRRELQAYWTQLETEWLRAERSIAGVLAFCYLANNYGFTGDWFINDIAALEAGPTLKWLRHCFSPAAVFIDLPDERYIPFMPLHQPGETIKFKLCGINDMAIPVSGKVKLSLLNSSGKMVHKSGYAVSIEPFGRKDIPVGITLPAGRDGYLVLAEFETDQYGKTISRRYIRAGENGNTKFKYFEYVPSD